MPGSPTVILGPLSLFTTHDRYLVNLSSLDALAPGSSSTRELVVFRLARQGMETFYAIESECPHAGAPMVNSELEFPDGEDGDGFGNAETGDIEDLGSTVLAVCPYHGYDFDLRTGESSTGLKACTWRVSVRDDGRFGKVVVMEGPENTARWSVASVQGVSEAFAEPTLPASIPSIPPSTLTDWACLILNTADPDQKVSLTREALRLMREGEFAQSGRIVGSTKPPDKPPRLPARKDVKPPRMGKPGSLRTQLVYLHNVTHIEQWAIDLAWDLIARFGARPFPNKENSDEEEEMMMPLSFFEDWATIAEEEAKHFTLLRARLEAKGSFYGEYKTQDGLWDSAAATVDDIKARLSIVCLVHEARGLDVNPKQIARFRELGDEASAEVMSVVHADEISHVAAGHRYLTYVCDKEGLDPVRVFRENVGKYYAGKLKGPFNTEDRAKAGLREDWYAGEI